jgi:hypothetical protein
MQDSNLTIHPNHFIGLVCQNDNPKPLWTNRELKNYNGTQVMVSSVNRPLEPGPELTYEIKNLSTIVLRNMNSSSS